VGAPSPYFSKLRIFDPNAIEETNYDRGGHAAYPKGILNFPERDELLLLHYKQLGHDYPLQRNRFLATGLGSVDLQHGWGFHYFRGPEEQAQFRGELNQKLVDISNSDFLPWRDHREARWWR
jgi:hypothetical protein